MNVSWQDLKNYFEATLTLDDGEDVSIPSIVRCVFDKLLSEMGATEAPATRVGVEFSTENFFFIFSFLEDVVHMEVLKGTPAVMTQFSAVPPEWQHLHRIDVDDYDDLDESLHVQNDVLEECIKEMPRALRELGAVSSGTTLTIMAQTGVDCPWGTREVTA